MTAKTTTASPMPFRVKVVFAVFGALAIIATCAYILLFPSMLNVVGLFSTIVSGALTALVMSGFLLSSLVTAVRR